MARGQDQDVFPYKKYWAVVGDGDKRATAIVPTQKEAIKIAREIARAKKSDVKIHGRDGKLRAVNIYRDTS